MSNGRKTIALVIEDEKVERWAEPIAVAEGVSVTEVVHASRWSLAGRCGMDPRNPPLSERLAALAHEVDALPPRRPADTGSDHDRSGSNEQSAE